jgi:hypothetical protein
MVPTVGAKTSPWGDEETLVLIALKGEQEYQRETGSSLDRLKLTKKERDAQIAQALTAKGYPRTGDQCNNRWDVIRTGFTKINDWNRRSGRESYWNLDVADKKKLAKARTLPVSYR